MDNWQIYTNARNLMLPEVCLVIGIIFTALWNLFVPRQRGFTPVAAMGFLGISAILLYGQLNLPTQKLLWGLYTLDHLTVSFGLLSCAFGILVVLMTMGYEYQFGNNRGEYYALLLTSVLSVMFLAGTTDLVMLFVGLETLTLAGVLLSGFAKHDRKSNEASLKYLLSTAATTATFLYGLSFLYGISGTTNYYELMQDIVIKAQSPSMVVVLLVVLLLSVIGFKLSMVPFHMWTPDVYEGAPTPVSAYLSVISKMGGLVVAIRLLSVVFGDLMHMWAPILGVLAIVSMIVGNFIALSQTSLKRMLAYSSIAHVGYLLIGLVANTSQGLSAMVFYMAVYGFMNLGAFAAAIMFENETGTDSIEEMSGLIRKRPFLAVALAICLLNLGGLPIPPAGFFAKVFIFWSGLQLGTPMGNWMVGMALVTSVPAVYYYTRVVIAMVVREPSERVAALPQTHHVVREPQTGTSMALALSVVAIVLCSTVSVTTLMNFSNSAVLGLGRQPTMGALPGSSVR